jgi:metal-responsive CopG/Arc/MetJ family transcriptional regulator
MVLVSRKQTLVQLSEELIEALDRRAATDGKSRSAVIRDAIELHLHDELEAERVRQYVEGYRRMPQTEAEMEWADWALDESLRALEEEEGEDGFEAR